MKRVRKVKREKSNMRTKVRNKIRISRKMVNSSNDYCLNYFL